MKTLSYHAPTAAEEVGGISRMKFARIVLFVFIMATLSASSLFLGQSGGTADLAKASEASVQDVAKPSNSVNGLNSFHGFSGSTLLMPVDPAVPLTWGPVPSPNNGQWRNVLTAVAVVSADDIWAVGYYDAGTRYGTLTLHWDGTSWTIVPSPNHGEANNTLSDVVAFAPDDVWAVGTYTEGIPQTLVLHWDGVEWVEVSSPSLGTGGSYLHGVSGFAPDDIWAVGRYINGGIAQTLTMHWDGTSWSVVPSPNLGAYGNVLESVKAFSSTDVWTVGYYSSTQSSYSERTLTMHWDGIAWNIVSSPSPGTVNSFLQDVQGTNGNDIWAVGTYRSTGAPYRTLTLHWDGATWSFVSNPIPFSSSGASLRGVTTFAPNDAWAVGYNLAGPYVVTLILHWDGATWEISSHQYAYALEEVVSLSGTEVWAVGEGGISGGRTLTLRYCNPCGASTRTPTATASGTSTHTSTATATATSTAIVTIGTATPTSILSNTPTSSSTRTSTSTSTFTATPDQTYTATPTNSSTYTPTSTNVPSSTSTSTPTSCPIEFMDVPEGSTFHLFIRCLACGGIISGYADGTFRPNNEVTRGQLAKIVSNSAGFTESPDPQIFEDVPSSNTFYQWINRLTRRGYMSGYMCGSPGEPCTTGRPYFRPFANATRGQTSKIVSNAAGYSEEPTEQAFEDVRPTHTFYREIQRLASRNIMGGYQCGGAGEPCISGRPYFRPANNVTRGQSAKIVANTFYPNCHTP